MPTGYHRIRTRTFLTRITDTPIAAISLAIGGIALWIGRRAPCPADLALARSRQRLRRWSAVECGGLCARCRML
jgi:hypothetical protein